jgi:hypothetical protein
VIGGSPEDVGRELARRARTHTPDSIGLTFATDDPEAALEGTLAAVHTFDKELR